MTPSGRSAQGRRGPRDAAPQSAGRDIDPNPGWIRSAGLLAVPFVMDMAMPVPTMTVRHGAATFRTEFTPLGVHASRDFRHVGNEVRTKPHRVGCAGLAGIDGLSPGTVKSTAECTGRQRQPANEMYGSH
jgi:hypothetical protein